MATRYAMAVDTVRCVGCAACVISCKTENDVPNGLFRDWIVEEVSGRYPDLSMQIRSERCHHCEVSPCVDACPTGASFVADGGIVAVDPDKCTGCRACIAACPYGARTVHPAGYVDKCTFCQHRVRDGRDPACVENCPTEALVFGDLGNPRSEVAKLVASRTHEVLKPENGTRPNLFFLT
jgi:tetrathionate reductase subunit B